MKTKPNGHRSRSTRRSGLVWIAGLLGLLTVAIFGLLFFQQNSLAAGSPPAEISVAAAAERQAAGALLLDVRQPEEWNEYHAPGAVLIPLGELESRLAELPLDEEIVVVCRSGNRSATGRDILRQAGFSNVTSMAGGMQSWRSAGYPIVTGE